MNKSSFTYRFGLIITGVVVWELIFWILVLGLLLIFGIIDGSSIGDHIAFRYTNVLWLNLLIIPVLAGYLRTIHQRNQFSSSVSSSIQPYIFAPVSSFHSFMKYFLFRNALICLIFAMAQPIYGNKKVAGTAESLELVIALDVSNSMNTRDIDKNLSRLDIAKRAMNQLVNNLHGEKLGISVFAGGCYVQLPLTSDYYAAKMFINEIETNMISRQGTNIAQALETSANMFSEAKTTKGIILVTDGENHEENPDPVLQQIAEKNIQLCVLGIGTEQGGLVPNNPKRPELGYKQAANGSRILSKVNRHLIDELASKAHGYSMISSDPFPNLTDLLNRVNHMERTKVDDIEFNVKENRYRIPLFCSFIFWIFFIVWSGSLFKFIDKFARVK